MYLTRGIKRDQKIWNAVKLKTNRYDLYYFQVCCCRSKIRWGCFDENYGSFKDLDVNSSWSLDYKWGCLWNSSEYMSNLLWDQTQVEILCFKFSLNPKLSNFQNFNSNWPKYQFFQMAKCQHSYSCITLQVT